MNPENSIVDGELQRKWRTCHFYKTVNGWKIVNSYRINTSFH